jgi:hypothetical protein
MVSITEPSAGKWWKYPLRCVRLQFRRRLVRPMDMRVTEVVIGGYDLLQRSRSVGR